MKAVLVTPSEHKPGGGVLVDEIMTPTCDINKKCVEDVENLT